MAISRETLEGEAILLETLEAQVVNIETLEGRWDSVKVHNTSIPRGDSREYRLEVTDENENVVNITGATIYFTVKSFNSDADPGAFQLSSANPAQITIDDGGNGKARIFVTNTNTQDLDIKRYVYDVQVQPASGGVKTVVSGTFTITEDITRTV
jgi:hypothetical protein